MRQFSAGSPDHDLHRLRITGKKLRYLVEFFRDLYPAAEIDLLIKAMKGIQDFLGEYQDCTVQQEHLVATDAADDGRGRSASGDRGGNKRTGGPPCGSSQHQLRRNFPECFEVFSYGRGRRGFVRLFAPAGESS
ncbi:MAG: CHAD domain-containing protein [Comamonadaceae bacterium]|nr:CHAD domain-containing protein [Comamonadaceae bacterium]